MTKFLTNKIGGYVLSGISSRYSGLFFMLNERMMKIVDDNFAKHKIILPESKNIAVINAKKYQELLLDVKESYDNSEFGRYYDVENNLIIFSKKTDMHIDYQIFIALGGQYQIKTQEKWIKREYKFDKQRNSQPSERYVYSPFKFKGKLILSVAETKAKALSQLKNLPSLRFYKQKTGLNQLLVKNKITGIYAGLPWFFQFWSRDELISLKALMLGGNSKEAKQIIMRNVNSIAQDGRLPNQTFPLSKKTNADSIGWLFKRIQDYQRFPPKDRDLIVKKLDFSINKIKENYVRDGLIYNYPLETWMDTEWADDKRDGFCIEIQCLYLNMLKLAYTLTRKQKYLKQEEEMKKIVRDRLWNGKYLADRLDDWTIRPNAFIAAYVYPELLTKKEWETCFQNLLPALWLPWGGLSTIDMNHPLFTIHHTGEITQSYHRGDSWYWINNLAAIVMSRASKPFFKKFVDQILKASKKEFTKLGIQNQQAELSSAKKLESQGCPAQAWSDAFLAELVYELR